MLKNLIQRGRQWLHRMTEASISDIYGTPVIPGPYDVLPFGFPGFGMDKFPEKTATLRTMEDHTRVRNVARLLAETNPHAHGMLRALKNYVIGTGGKVSYQSPEEEQEETPVRLTKNIKQLIRKFSKANELQELELELLARLHVDGEFFIRLFPDEDGVTKIRLVEPVQIQPPMGQNHEGPWSYGIYTPDNDVQRPTAYNVHDFQTGEDEEVEAQFIIHTKINVTKNQKRGVSSFYSADVDLRGAERLRYVVREGEKVRSAIAYFRQWATAPKSSVQTIQDAAYTNRIDVPTINSTRTITVQHIDPGSVVDAPQGMEVVAPPQSVNSESAANGIKQALEAAAAALQLPVWMVSGDSTASSYASSLTSESPFVKEVEAEQAIMSRTMVRLLESVIEIATEQDLLPLDTLDQVKLAVEYPSCIVRNLGEETERNVKLHEAGVLSKKTWAAQEGLDYDDEQSNLASEPAPAVSLDANGNPAPATMGGQMKQDLGV